jgi:broad specificity phosphatase PhoE
MAQDIQPMVRALRGGPPPQDPDAVRNMVSGLLSKSEVEKKPMRQIQIIRHGATKLNNDDVSVDRIRGWKDIPLSKDGEDEAHTLAGKIAKDPPDSIVSSDLKRAHDTAKIISDKSGVPLVDVTQNFRPWNVGEYSGQVTSKAIPILGDYAANKPDEPVPGGESFNDFKDRFLGGVRSALSENQGKLAIVTHHRGERLLNAWKSAGFPEDGNIDVKEFNKKGEHTGAVTHMDIPVNKVAAAVKAEK